MSFPCICSNNKSICNISVGVKLPLARFTKTFVCTSVGKDVIISFICLPTFLFAFINGAKTLSAISDIASAAYFPAGSISFNFSIYELVLSDNLSNDCIIAICWALYSLALIAPSTY